MARPSLDEIFAADSPALEDIFTTAQPKEKRSLGGEFVAGVKQGVLQLPQMAGGVAKLVGDAVGSETLSEYGSDVIQKYSDAMEPYAAEVGSYTQIDGVGDALKYAAHGVGALMPTVAAALVPGGIGAGIARTAVTKGVAREVVKRGIQHESVDLLKRGALKKTLDTATKAGAMAGAGASSYGMEAGSIYVDQTEHGIKQPLKAAALAAPAAALDVIPELRILSKIPAFKALQEFPIFKTAEGGNALIRGAKEALTQGGTEGATEFAQTLFERVGANKEAFTPEGIEEAINAGLIGAIGGGVIGGAIGTVGGSTIKDKDLLANEDDDIAKTLRELRHSNIVPGAVEQPEPIASPAPVEQRPPGPIMDSEAATPEDQEIMAMQQENELYRQQQLMDRADIPVIQEKEPEIPTSFRSADGKSNVRTKRLDDGTYEVSTTSVDEYGNKKTFAKKMTAKEADEHINKLMPEPTRDEYLKVNAPEVKEGSVEPEVSAVDRQANEAATSPQNDLPEPTEAQIKSGNYKKGNIQVAGLNIAVENPAGSVRKGTDETGRPWQTELKSHYGYVKKSEGADGDAVDIFVKPGTEDADRVFVVDQKNMKTGGFDEHKAVIGTASVDEARQLYLESYDETGPSRIQDISEVSVDEFKDWLKNGDTSKPFTAHKDIVTFKPILDQLTAQTGVQVNKSNKGFSTTSDFQMALKEGWPTVRKGIETGSFEKSEVIKALKNITEGKRLGAAQQRVIDAFREDIARYEEVTAEQQTQDASVEAELQAEREAMQEEGGDTSFEFGEELGNDNLYKKEDPYKEPDDEKYLITNDRVKADGYGVGTKYEIKEPEGDTVTVYRSVPADVDSIQPGDYVTASKKYAEDHLEMHTSGRLIENPALAKGGKIISAKIPKSELVVYGGNELIWKVSRPVSDKLFPTPPTFGKKPQGKGSVSENPMLTEMKEREAESKQETISFSQNTGGANGRSFEGKVVGANSTSASKQLEDALSKDGFNIARGSYEQLEVVGEDAEALQALTASLGRELVFIRRTPNGRLRNAPNPFAMSDGRTIYINYENNKQLLFLLGHELTHTIARSDPEVYAKLKQVVIKYTDMAGAKRSYLASNMLYRNVSEDLVTEEVVGNLMGEYFNDPKFWKEVAKDKSFFEKMRSIVEAVLEKASEILNGYTAHFVKDIDAVRKAMAEAVVESAKSQSKSGGQVRFAQTVPDTTKERSDDDMRGISERDTDLVQPSDGQAMGASPSAQADRISEAKQRAHSVLDSLKAFVNNPGGLGKLPSQLEYLARRYRVLGTISEINDLTADWGKAFKGATKEENAAIYDYLTTKDADPLLVPEKFRKKAVEGKQMVIDIGEKLVAYGILSESVFEKNKGEYLPRVYLKFLIGEDTARVLGTGKKLDLNYLKSRKDIPEDVRRLILGEVKDPGFLLSKAFSIPSRDMALIDWLATISQNQEWVMPKSLIEWSMDENPARDLGRINYRQNDDGTYNLTITEVKTVETKHKGIKTADLQTFLGNDKIAAYIAAGKGKPVLRKTEANGKTVYKPTPWKKVGRIQYKTEPDGTMTFKLKERVTSKKTHNNVTDSQLDQLAGKRADGIRAGEGKAENSQVMTPWHLAAEADRLQKQIDYMPAEDRKEAEEVARRMRKTADAAIADLPISPSDVPENFKQIPDSPKYGALRGLIVRREIYDDIVGSVNVSIGDQSAMEKLLGSNGTVSKLTGMWKWSKVAANPPAQVRNFVSNMVLLDLSGVNTLMVPVRIAQAAKEIASNGKHWQIAKSYGVKEATFSNTEMVRINEELVRILAKDKAGWTQIYQWAKFLASWGVNRTSDLYQFMESVGKTAKIIDEMTVKRNHGTFAKPDVRVSTAEEAAMEAHKWLFDYSLVSRNTKYLRNAPIGVPFMTFLTKIAPRLIEVAVKKPWRFTPYATLAYGLPYWIAGMLDIDDDDYEKIMAALPEWIREKQHVYLLPWKDEKGRWQAMDLGYYFPWTAWTTMGEGVYEFLSNEKDFSEASSKVGQGLSVGGPLSDLIAASKTGIDPFTQRKIVDKYADPSEQVAQVFGYLYQMAMPPFLTQRGTAGKLYSALTNELGKDRLPKATEAQAALSTVGMNLYGYDANMTRAQSIKRMQFDIAGLKRQAKSELSNPNLTETEKDELRDKFREKIQRMNNKMLKYAKSSMPSQKELLKRETQ